MRPHLLTLITLIILSSTLYGATITWTNGSTDGLWNTPANWSSGTVPLPTDDIVFDATSVSNCTVDAPGASFDGINVAASYSGVIDINGQSFSSTGIFNCIFTGGTISDTPGTSTLGVTTSGNTTFNGTIINARTNVSTGRLFLNGSVFNGISSFTQTGATGSTSAGGNTFNADVSISTTDQEIRLGNTNPDVFNALSTFTNTGNSLIRIGYNSAGNVFNGNVVLNATSGTGIRFSDGATGTTNLAAGFTITIGASGFTSGNLYFIDFTQSGGTAQSLTLTGTAYLYNNRSSWGGNIVFTAPRIRTDNSSYSGTVQLEKTGAVDDASAGGNTMVGDVVLINSGSRYFLMGNGTADDFQGNVTMNNTGTHNMYIGDNGAGHSITGNLVINHAGSSLNTFVGRQAAAVVDIGGNLTITNTSNGNSVIYVANSGTVTIGGDFDINNTAIGASALHYVANAATASVTITGSTTLTNSGTGATDSRMFIGENGDITFNGTLDITNTSTSNNSHIYLNRLANSTNLYNEDITVQSTAAGCDGVRFGEAGGFGTLAATKTITIGAGGFVDGYLYFRNFTQTGATPHNLTLTGNAFLYNYDSNWGGDVVFTSPRIFTRGTTYNGTSQLEKTGASGDNSSGGNTFVGNAVLNNSGSGQLAMGNGSADDWQGDLVVNNSGSNNLMIALASAGNAVSGNLTWLHSGSAVSSNISNNVGATIDIVGNLDLTNTGNANSTIYIGNSGSLTVGGDFDLINSSTATSTNHYIANGATSSLVITGASTITNSGTETTTGRIYVANQGDITFNGVLTISNSSTAVNNQVYCNNNVNSANQYNENIILESTNAASDGIYFGSANGSGVLAATKTVTVGAGGFIAGQASFRNFTQLGPTAQSIALTGTGYFLSYDSNWGGDVVFSAPRINTRGTTYNGTSELTKNGDIADDASIGGNTFVGDCILRNLSIGNYFMMGNGTADDWQADLDVLNIGSDHMYIAYNSAGNTLAGTLDVTHSNAAGTTQFCNNTNSTMDITGSANLFNTSSGTANIYFGVNGDMTFGSTLDITNSGTGATSQVFVANSTNSSVTIDGPVTVTNNNSATGNGYCYLGNSGDITFNGTLTIDNSSTATNSSVFCNYGAASVNVYNENIILTNSNAASDGVLFGANTGQGTLAANKTVTLGAGGFIAGELRFRNFTQVGPTAQTLTLTGTALCQNYDSNWGGDIIFIAPRMLTRGTTYNGISYLEKTGSVNDQSAGGNTFVGNCDLIHTGANQFLMGNGTADIWQGNLNVENSGSGLFYLAHNSAGNTIAGTLDWTTSGTSSANFLSTVTASTLDVTGIANFTNNSSLAGNAYIYVGDQGDVTFASDVNIFNAASGTTGDIRLANNTNSLVSVAGNLQVTNNGTSTTSNVYIGNNGDVGLTGALTVLNQGTGTTSQFFIANGGNSAVTIGGASSLTNTGGITTTRSYLGNNGDITFNGTLDVLNSSSSTNSEVYLCDGATSVGLFNENITVQSTNAVCDGVRFGENNGVGTLAATKTITLGAGGFISGDLRFRNFTQVGATPQGITCTGTARIYNYDSQWDGDVTFLAPRHITRGTTYNGNADLTKNGASNDDSAGDNVFNGVTVITNTGPDRMRLSATAGMPDDYNDDVSFIKLGAGALQPAFNNDNTFSGDINLSATTTLTLGNGAGRIVFDGAAAQAVNDLAATPEPIFERIRTSNASDEITLNMPISVSVESDFVQGNLNTTTTNLLTMTDNSTVATVSDNAFVDGPMDKIGNDPFAFPVGDLGVYQPISISAPTSGAARFRAEYFNFDSSPTYDDTQLDPTIHHISDCEYWTLDRIATTNNVSVNLAFKPHTGACSGVTDPSTLIVARWDGSVWRDHGNDGAPTGGPTAGSITTAAAVTSFSPFTLASTVDFPVNPLPVELLMWEASKNGNNVDLNWSTASEIDNAYFMIEKSNDGVHYEEFKYVAGAINSTSLINYFEVDLTPVSGWNYYRLTQTDQDDTKTDLGIRKVYFESVSGTSLAVYPNPSNDGLVNIQLNSDVQEGNIQIYDASGKLVKAVTINSNNLLLDMSGYSTGFYTIVVNANNNVLRESIILK